MREQTQRIPWSTLWTGFAAALGLPFLVGHLIALAGFDDPVQILMDAIVGDDRGFAVGVSLTGGLVAIDRLLTTWSRRQSRILYDLLKAVGDAVREGKSIEEALRDETATRRGHYPSLLRKALADSGGLPLAHILRDVASGVSDAGPRETLQLVANALDAEGDVGPVLRWLGQHQTDLVLQETVFERKLSGTLVTMRGMGLFVAPFLFSTLAAQVDANVGVPASAMRAGFFFYAVAAVMMAALDGLVFGRWLRAVPKIPFFLGLVRRIQGW